MIEYPIYVLSRHKLGSRLLYGEGHSCCLCNDEKSEPEKAQQGPPVYGYEIAKFVGLKNAKPGNKNKALGEPHEFPELVAGGPSKEAMIAVLRLLGIERIQDFTYKGASWDVPPKHWRDL